METEDQKDEYLEKISHQETKELDFKDVMEKRIFFKDYQLETSTEDFTRLAASGIFVDKSLFIKEVIDYRDSVLILRPQKWGKSLNLQMLRIFLEVKGELDESGLPLSRVYFQGGTIENQFYRPLKITHAEFKSNPAYYMEKYQAKYPVVLRNLKDIFPYSEDVDPREKVIAGLKSLISSIFSEKQYLLDWFSQSEFRKGEKQEFLKVLNGENVNLIHSLEFLIRELYDYHNKTKVFILVDGYDSCTSRLIQAMIIAKPEMKPNLQESIQTVAEIITNFLCPMLKGNEYVEQGVIVGVYNTLYIQGDSGLDNIVKTSINDCSFSRSFGNSREEILEQIVRPLLDTEKNPLGTDEAIMKMMDKYYNGYLVPLRQMKQLMVYNAFSAMSLINALKTRQIMLKQPPEKYWINSGESEILQNLDKVRDNTFKKLLLLVARNDVEFKQDVGFFRFIDSSNFGGECLSDNWIRYSLQNSGYIMKVKDGSSYYRIPNQEILERFGEKVLSYWAEKTGVKTSILRKTYEEIGMSFSEKSKFETCLNQVLSSEEEAEDYFLCLIVAGIIMCNIYEPEKATHQILVPLNNSVHGMRGNIGNIFYPIKDSSAVIIQNYKVAREEKEIEEKMEEAKWQIFIENKMEEPVERHKLFPDKFDKIEVRAQVFWGRMGCQFQSLEFNLEEAEKIVTFFSGESQETEILRNNLRLNQTIEFDKRLLLKNYNVNNLEDYLEVLAKGGPKSMTRMLIEDQMEKILMKLFKKK